MKCLINTNRFFYLILALGFFQMSVNAQSFLNKHYLSEDVKNLIHSNPDQALKIAQYLLSKTNTDNREKAKVNFLISKAYFVKGDYSSALNFLYEEKNYEDYLSELQKIDIQLNKVNLLRELALDKQAQKTLDQLVLAYNDKGDQKQNKYLKSAVVLEKAKFLLKANKNQEGIDILLEQTINDQDVLQEFKELQLGYFITLGQLFLNQKELKNAQKEFESALAIINKLNDDNSFTKIDALQGLAEIAFIKKDHKTVVALSEEAMVYAKRFNNIFLQIKIAQLQSAGYLILNDIPKYKTINKLFIDLQSETEAQEQEAINTAYNLISDEYTEEYSKDKNSYLFTLYIVLGFFIVALLIALFFWQKLLQRKKGLDEIMSYIEITRSNLLSSFNVTDKKQEPKKNSILKETEEQILIKLKRFESSKRFINKDISLAVLAGQLDSNTKYLSEIINTHYNVNFNTYINKLRINYIIEKLKTDPNYINYKISYLAENCGFSSHSSFATVFKSITGISPVKFIELLNQEKDNTLLEE
jgi:AraC-like DNA-binding protein